MLQSNRPIIPSTWSNPQSLIAYIKDAQDNLLNIIPPSAFTQDFISLPSRFGATHYVSNPNMLREILKTRVEDFPKSKSAILLIEPIAPDSILITHGEKWKSMHNTMMPVFNRRNVENFAPIIERLTRTALEELPFAGNVINVSPHMQNLTYQVISNVLVGADNDEGFEKYRHMFEEFLESSGRFSLLDIPPIYLHILPNYRKWRYHKQIKRNRQTGEDVIRKRLKSDPANHQDFLEYLMTAYDLRNNPTRERRYEVEDNMVTFLIAGHETTTMALSWGLYAAGFFPDAQDAIADEARLPWNERKFTDAFLKEVMRIYPPVPIFARVTTQPENINGLSMKKREGVLIPVLAIHRHCELWDRPDEFVPDRFVDFTPAPMTYMPFGAGPRVCIGQSFAMMEANIIFPMILEKYRIEPSGQIPEPEQILTLRSRNGMKVKFTPR